MTKRERTLAMLVAFLVPVVLLFMVFFWFLGKYNANEMQLIGLRSDIQKATTLYDEAQSAKQRLIYYGELSLPASLSKTDIVLKDWVNKMAAETNLKFVSLKPREQRDLKSDSRIPVKIGKVRTSTVRLEGKLDEIVDFLHKFYSFGALKRITELSVTPKTIGGEGPNKSTRSGRFAFDLDFDAVFLDDADRDKEVGTTAIALAQSFDEYRNRIGQRNVFAPANNPPVLPATIDKSYDQGLAISFPVEAQDADEQDQLSFELMECSLPSADITWDPGSRRATFRCSPLEVGEYKFGVRVIDDGNPSKDSTSEVSLTITKKKNSQPVLTAKSFEAYAGEPIEFELAATDKDEQAVKIEMFENESLPDGVLTPVEGESRAVFTHPPIEDVREYEFEVKLDDGGEPRIFKGEPKDNLETITLKIVPAKFVNASQTKITSIINLNGIDRVWIDIRPIRKEDGGGVLDVVVGDSFELDRKTWIVKSISVAKREVVLEVDDVIKTYQFGDFLSEPRSEEKLPDGKPAEPTSTSVDEGAEANPAVAKLKLGATSADK